MKQPDVAVSQPSAHNSHILLEKHEVRHTAKGVNPRKAAGLDGIPGRVQLAGVFTRTLNSPCPSILPEVLCHHPTAERKNISSMNGYRLVALTPITMACFEKLGQVHIISSLPPALDSHHFAYGANRST